MADAITTGDNTRNDIIVSAVQKNLIEKAVLASTVRDVSVYAVEGSEAFRVPKLTNFTVTNRAFGTAADAEALQDSWDRINIDFNAYIAWLYDSRSVQQSSVDFQVESATRASLAHAKYVDEQIVTTLEAVAAIQVDAGVTTGIKGQITEMRAELLNRGADISRMSIAINPLKEKDLFRRSRFRKS